MPRTSRDISKPLRLIGIQIFEGTSPSILRVLSPGWYPFIKCRNDDEMGQLEDAYPLVAEDGCPDDYYRIDKRLPKVSISAIAGKNGSGKSSLLEVLYRILANFAGSLLAGPKFDYVKGLRARLYFEFEGILKYIQDDRKISYYEILDGVGYRIDYDSFSDLRRLALLDGFFYTICVNYSLYAFNPDDYQSPFGQEDKSDEKGDWLRFLFQQTNNYQFPLVLTPFRDKGRIDVGKENELARKRIEVLSLLFHSQSKEVLNDYAPYLLKFKYNPQYSDDFQQSLLDNPIRKELAACQITLIKEIRSLWKWALAEEPSYHLESIGEDRVENAIFVLAYETLCICLSDPDYKRMSDIDSLLSLAKPVFSKRGVVVKDHNGQGRKVVSASDARSWLKDSEAKVLSLIKGIIKAPSNHITVEIHQCLDFLRMKKYIQDEGELKVDDELLLGEKYESFDDVLRLLPPPFFYSEVTFRPWRRRRKLTETGDITIQSMSSGERQLLYSLSSVFYHISNIVNIKVDNKRAYGYHHVNLIFDEAELYYHPEFQRQFILRLLESFAMFNFNRRSLRSINIILITHSPFILSDLPETNILFLRKGDEVNDEVPRKTLGANIYDLLRNGFFLDYAIGDIVQNKLQEIIHVYYDLKGVEREKAFQEKKAEFWFTINHLGEEYLHRSFLHLYEELERSTKSFSRKEQVETKIQSLQNEINRLQAQLEEECEE